MNIGSDLQESLANVIGEEVPIADEYEGRTTLMRGIDNQNGWRRYRDNKRLDILKIIEYATKYVSEDSENISSWGLIIFINNALYEIKGTATAKKLQELKQKCILCWEKEHNNTYNSNIKGSEQVSIRLLSTEQACSTELSHPQHSSLSIEDSSQKAAFWDFFNTATCLVQATLKDIEAAQEPFVNSSSSVSNAARRRHALTHLDSVPSSLQQLRKHIEESVPLPEAITANRHLLRNQINSLIELIQQLRAWINNNSGAVQAINDQFTVILQKFTYFKILKGDD